MIMKDDRRVVMKKRKFLIGGMVIIYFLALGLSISYSMWNMTSIQKNSNVISTSGCFDVSITSQKNSINLENSYPITNKSGKTLIPFSFTITNTCDIFASYIVSLESLKDTTLGSKFLNVMVNNEEIKKLSDYETTEIVNSGSIESHILAKGSLGSGDSEDYTLRVWIDYDTTMEDLDNETKTFNSKVVVKAQPSSWSPVNEGDTTLHDAILANEYQSSPEIAIQKIKNKEEPNFHNPSPLLGWSEKSRITTIDIIKPSESSIKIDDTTSNLNINDSLVWLWNNINADLTNGKYQASNSSDGFYSDLENIDFNLKDYYTYGENTVLDSDNKLKIYYNSNSDKIMYKILDATKKDSKTIWNGKEYDSITYTLKVVEHTIYSKESDKSEKGLYAALDDYGISYYYRGSVLNNNVYFAGMKWKIVRINGDGSVRLLYNGTYENNDNDNIGKSPFSYKEHAAPEYMYGDETGINNHSSNVKDTIDAWFSNTFLSIDYNKYLSDSGFCDDREEYKSEDNVIFYKPYERLIEKKAPSLKCSNSQDNLLTVDNEVGNKSLIYSVSLISADEAAMAGIIDGSSSSKQSFLYSEGWYWTLGAMQSSRGYTIGSDNSSSLLTTSTNSYFVRPVINLKADVEITGGIGTSSSPFIIKTN